MYPQVALVLPVRLLLLPHIRLMLIIHKINNWHPRIAVVHVVAETRAVDHRKLGLELLLLKFSLDNLHLGQLVKLLVVATGVVLRWRKLS